MAGDVGVRGVLAMEPHLLARRELPKCLPVAALHLLSLLVQSGHLPCFPKLGSAFAPIWKCSHREAKSGREAPQDSHQLPSRG